MAEPLLSRLTLQGNGNESLKAQVVYPKGRLQVDPVVSLTREKVGFEESIKVCVILYMQVAPVSETRADRHSWEGVPTGRPQGHITDCI